MSVVTNVLLHVGVLEEVTLDLINAEANVAQQQSLNDLAGGDAGELWGGSKYPEVTVYGAAFNYLLVETFMDSLAAIPWTEPDNVQLFICRQDEDRFTVYQLADKRWVTLHA